MTAAEKIEEFGRKKGREESRVEIAVNFLKDGVEPRIIARNTGLELAVILKLKAQHRI
jgi:hypothetical protein